MSRGQHRAPLHRTDRARWSGLTRLVAIPLVFALTSGVAWAYWSAGSSPGGNGASAATSVNPGATPTATVAGHAVTVSWAAATLTNGQAVNGYLVKRYDAGTLVVQTILSACTGTITALTCTESSVPTGSWKYSATPVFATSWQGAESAKSSTVTVLNAAPVAVANTYSVNEDTTLSVAATGVLANDSDLEGATLTAILASGVANGLLTFSPDGGFTYTPNPNFNGSDSFTYKVNDGANDSNTVTVTLTVTAVNDAPVNTVPGPQQTPKNTSRVFSTANNNLISISDVDAGGAVVQVQLTATIGSVTLTGLPGGLTFTAGDGTADATMTFTGTISNINSRLAGATFIPTNNLTGAATLQIVTNDLGNAGGGALTATDSIAINVNALGIFTASRDIGVPPGTAGSSSFTTGTYTVTGSGADIWGSADHFQFLSRTMTGDGRLTARVASQTAPAPYAKAGVMFRDTLASDSMHAMMDMEANQSEFVVRKATGAQSPVASSTNPLAAPYWVRLTRAGATFTAERSLNGATWTQQGATETIAMGSTIEVGLAVTSHDIAAVNAATFDNVALTTPPTATADSYSVNEDTTLTIAANGVLANDSDPESNTLTAVLGSGTTGLTLNTNGSFTYVPPTNFSGPASFTYKANDGVFDSSTVTVNLTVNPANETPGFTKGANQTTAQNAGAQTVAGWATAITQGTGETGQLVDFIVTNTNNSLFSVQPAVSATGTLSYTLATNATGVATVSVKIHDNGGTANAGLDTSAIQTFTVSVGATAYGIFTDTSDIGSGTAGPTSSSFASSTSTYTEVGNGTDVYYQSDQFHYLYRSWTGDGTVIARVTGLTNTHGNAKAGVMFRETAGAGSAHAFMEVKPVGGAGAEWMYRGSTDGSTTGSSTTGPAPTYWVKLVRSGSTFTGSSAPDSSGSPGTWTERGTQSITMATTILVGLATNSHSAAVTTTATYDNVSLAGPAAPVLIATGSALAYTENATSLLDSGITATDADSANLASVTVTMTTAYVNGQDTLAFTDQNGITGTWTAATGILALTGTATVAQYQTALRSITYTNNSNAPNTTTRTVTIVASDGAVNSNVANRTITLTAVNDAPVNSVPGAQILKMNTPLVFSSGNLISISDSDAGVASLQVQLSATNATLTLSGASGLTFTVGDGTADPTMTFTGTIGNINAALAGLSSTTIAAGAVTVQIITSDQGNTGTGGTLSDTDTITATFPNYFTQVNADAPWFFYRGEEAPSAAATSTANDSSANNRPGTYAGQTNGPSTRWKLAEGSGTVAADSSGAANPGTIGSGNTWLADRTDKVLNFSGTNVTTGYVQSAAPAVRTDASFTVSAWVNTSTAAGPKTALSQIGTNNSAFYLQVNSAGRWAFALGHADTAASTGDTVASMAPAATDTWTHLVGVYNDAADSGELYVNGVSQGTIAHIDANEWNATGLMQAGRAWWNGGFVDPWAGKLDDVRTYRRALSAAEVSAVYGDAPSLVWDFEENTGTSTADRSGFAISGAVGAGAAWTTAGHTGNALQFDNTTDDYVFTSTEAPINTTASFTVSTWVNMNSAGAATKGILSQQGTTESTLILKRESSGKWGYSLAGSASGAGDQILSASTATTDTWVQLVAVYDSAAATTSKMQLYVNGSLSVSGPHATTYGTTNPLQLSRIRYGGAWVDPFDGEIDDVRTYRRALTAAEITNLYAPVAEAGMTAGVPGALQGAQQGLQATTAVAFGGTANAYSNTQVAGPGAFTLESWFKASGTGGGQLMAFTSDQTGLTSASRDRMVYLDSGNRLTFGTWPVSISKTVRSTLTYNDGARHHMAASLGAAGLKLYVDGVLVASDATTTTAGSYTGYWRWGGGSTGSWPNRPTNDYFTGTLDEVAVFSSQLTDTQIAEHYYANH